jgi:hypothetical protein
VGVHILHPCLRPNGRCDCQARLPSGDRVHQMRRPALPLAKHPEREAEVVLRRRPVERRPIARPFEPRGSDERLTLRLAGAGENSQPLKARFCETA